MIVADTNLIAYRMIDGDQTELALAVWAIEPDWYVPPLWRHEFLSVLAVHARHGNLTERECLTLFEQAVLLFQSREHQPNLSEALSLALQKKITPYDAQFVLLAQQLGTLLVTSDRELLNKFPLMTISPLRFVDKTAGSVCETRSSYTAKPTKRSRAITTKGTRAN